jgi:F-type H+-transporting ATPase subunit delta
MLLFEKGRFPFLQPINDFFQKLSDELKGVGRATVTAAAELSAEAVERIRGALSQRTGKDIVLDVRKDPNLLGGVVTQIGDLVLDGSIRTQLLKLRESIKKGEGV